MQPEHAYHLRCRRSLIAAIIVGVVAFILFLKTMAPAITFHDAGDFVSAAKVLGVPHPPGYPLYTILAFLFAKIPIGTITYRVGLLSGVSAAIAVSLFTLAGYRLTDSIPAGAIGGLSIAFSLMFWSRAEFAETYSLNLLFVAAILLAFLVWEQDGKSTKHLCLAAFLIGLSLTNHPTILLIIPSLAFFFYDSQPSHNKRELSIATLFVLMPLLLYAYEPIRAMGHPLKNWGDPSSIGRFLDHIFVSQYRGSLQQLPTEIFGERLSRLPRLIAGEYSWPLVLIGFGGVVYLFRRNVKYTLTLLLICMTIILFFARNAAADKVVFEDNFMTAYAIWGLFIAVGCVALLKAASYIKPIVPVLTGLALLALVGMMMSDHYSKVDKSHYFFARRHAETVLDSMPLNSIMLSANDNFLAPLDYMQIVEGKRRDIVPISIGLVGMQWYRNELDKRHIKLPKGIGDLDQDHLQLEIVELNRDRPIFLSTANTLIMQSYSLAPRGPLLMVADKRAKLPTVPDLVGFNINDSIDDDALELNAQPYLDLGVLYLNEDDYDKALELFSTGNRMAPHDIRYYSAIAMTWLQAGNPDKALQAARNGLKIDKTYPSLYSIMALAANSLHDHDLAYESAGKAIKLNPDDVQSILLLAYQEFEGDEYEKALDLSLRARSIDPNEIKSHFIVALSAERLAKYALAVEEWRFILERAQDPALRAEAKRHLKIFNQ